MRFQTQTLKDYGRYRRGEVTRVTGLQTGESNVRHIGGAEYEFNATYYFTMKTTLRPRGWRFWEAIFPLSVDSTSPFYVTATISTDTCRVLTLGHRWHAAADSPVSPLPGWRSPHEAS